MATRRYDFIVGPETPVAPTAGTPTASGDLVTKGYVDTNTASASSLAATQAEVDAVETVLAAHEATEGEHLPSQTGQAGRVLQTDGTNLSWEAVAAGGGGINLVDNTNATDDTTGYTDSGTSTDVTRTTTTADIPLYPYKETAVQITNSGSGTDYTSFDVTVPPSLVNTELELSWYQKPGATYVSSDMEVQVFSGATEIATRDANTSGDTFIPASTGKFRTSFNPGGNSAIQVRIKRAAGAAASYLTLNEVTVGPGAGIATAPNISEWKADTLTTTWTANTTTGCVWRRVGSNMEIMGKIQCSGVPTAAVLIATIPDGKTIDTSALPNVGITGAVQTLGHGVLRDASTRSYPINVTYSTTTQFYFVSAETTGNTESTVEHDSPIAFNTNDILTFTASVPIAEWSGGSNVYLGSNDVEYLSHDGTNVVYGPKGSLVPNTSVGTATEYNITVPAGTTDDWVLEVDRSFGIWTKFYEIYPYTRQNTQNYGAAAYASGTTQMTVYFGGGGALSNGATYGAAGGVSWGSRYSVGYRWRLRRCKAGSPVGFGMATAENAGLVKANRWQRKELASAVTTENTDFLTFSNLEVGKTYRFTANVTVDFTSTDNIVLILVRHNSATVAHTSFGDSVTSGTRRQQAALTYTFVATGTSVNLRTSSVSTGVSVLSTVTGSSGAATYAELEELSNVEAYTGW